MCVSEAWAKKSQREEDLLVSALSNTFNSTNGFSSGVEKNGIIQTILQITEIGGSIGAKIKRMVLTPLGSHYGRYKEKFDEKELPEHKKCIGSTVFQVILNSGGGFAERICYLE